MKTSSDSYSGRTALAYVTEKMHQNDENGAIADGTFDGENALVIRRRYDEKDYVTYLYAYDGYLRELFIRDGTEAKASDGRKILATKDFEAKCEERCKIDWRRFMERTPAKRSSLFLLELMIAILFFCLASAVCVQIFVKAHTISRETQELNTALEKVSGYTELFLADALTEDTEVFYDASWQECSKDEASYEIVIRVEPDGKLLHGTFTVQRLSGEQPEEIYSVETDRMTGTERE